MNYREEKHEMILLFESLKKKNIPTREDAIYLSDGLYLLPNGDVLEESIL